MTPEQRAEYNKTAKAIVRNALRVVDWRTIPPGAVWCIGQHSKADVLRLERQVRKGTMYKVRAHWQGISPLKTVYVPVTSTNRRKGPRRCATP